MNTTVESVVKELRERFGEGVEEVREFRDDVIVVLHRDALVDAAKYLRDNTDCPFPLCEDVFGIDAYERTKRFEVNYHFFSLDKNVRLHFKVRVDEDDAVVPTLTGVYPSAGWYERETFDMYGITFDKHPDLRRAYMPEDYEYYPLRKDYPLMGVPGDLPLPKRG
ncbi:MAG: NADH-quinone oxidoreductase subunit C [Ignavibacteria bacterium]|nr:MAG: NADH-quinone oxidoreductase subunit C [Ignavibacteria bacterium]